MFKKISRQLTKYKEKKNFVIEKILCFITPQCIQFSKGVKGRRKKTISCGPVRKVLRQKTVILLTIFFYFFFYIFRYAYQKIQNGLKRMFLINKKKTVLTDILSKNFIKYVSILFLFRTFCIFFYLNKLFWLRTGDWPPPPFTDQSEANRFFLRPP